MLLFPSVTLGFSPMCIVEIEQYSVEWQLIIDRPHLSPLPYQWFIFHLPFCSPTTSWIFSPRATSLLNRNDCNDTQKRWLSGFGISAVLHVTHPLAITSANKLIQCTEGKHVGMVGGERGEKGVGGVKRGIRGFILLSVMIANLWIYCLLKVEWKQAHLVKLIPFQFQVYRDNHSLQAFVATHSLVCVWIAHFVVP